MFGAVYKVSGFRHVSTPFGPRVIADFKGSLSYFLSNSYGKLFKHDYDDDSTNINSFDVTMMLKGFTKEAFITPILQFQYLYTG